VAPHFITESLHQKVIDKYGYWISYFLCFCYTLLSLPPGSVTDSSLAYVAKNKSSETDSGEENMSKKDLALHQAIDQITSAFGKGAIMWLRHSQGHRDVPVVSTGSLDLDMALGTGCDGTSQVIRPTYSCPCPMDLRQSCRCT
jgi:hypothetical protein